MNSWQVWLYVAAVLVPLGAFALELTAGRLLGRLNAYLSTGAIATSLVLSTIGFVSYLAANPGMLALHEEDQAIVEGPERAEARPAPPRPRSSGRRGSTGSCWARASAGTTCPRWPSRSGFTSTT